MAMKESDVERYNQLVVWARENGGLIHPRIEIYSDAVTKFSFRVRRGTDKNEIDKDDGVRAGDVVASCAHPMMLSYLNAILGGPLLPGWPSHPRASTFPSNFTKSSPPHVVGRFFLIQQYLLCKASHWSAYIETLPQPERLGAWSLPPFWPESDCALAEGTNVGAAVEEIQKNLSKEFKAGRKLLKAANYPDWQSYTRLLYNWAYSIYTSRSFRPSLLFSSETRTQISKLLSPGCEIDDFSILLPLVDIANHCQTAKIDMDTSKPMEVCFRTDEQYSPGDQVFLNYGMKTNSELLLAYGFMIPETEDLHNDYVHVRKRREDATPEDDDDVDPNGQDFLISLRPIRHSSSLTAKSRQFVLEAEAHESASPFDHFEDALLWDMCLALATPEEHELYGLNTPYQIDNRQSATVASVSDESPPSSVTPNERQIADGRQIVSAKRRILGTLLFSTEKIMGYDDGLQSRVRRTLSAKLKLDYDRLTATDMEVPEEANTLTQNQLLLLQYRRQCKRVLRNAHSALDPSAKWGDE
jgi:protein-histidine N-methyltransferase